MFSCKLPLPYWLTSVYILVVHDTNFSAKEPFMEKHFSAQFVMVVNASVPDMSYALWAHINSIESCVPDATIMSDKGMQIHLKYSTCQTPHEHKARKMLTGVSHVLRPVSIRITMASFILPCLLCSWKWQKMEQNTELKAEVSITGQHHWEWPNPGSTHSAGHKLLRLKHYTSGQPD